MQDTLEGKAIDLSPDSSLQQDHLVDSAHGYWKEHHSEGLLHTVVSLFFVQIFKPESKITRLEWNAGIKKLCN